jgi:hypothetical protein
MQTSVEAATLCSNHLHVRRSVCSHRNQWSAFSHICWIDIAQVCFGAHQESTASWKLKAGVPSASCAVANEKYVFSPVFGVKLCSMPWHLQVNSHSTLRMVVQPGHFVDSLWYAHHRQIRCSCVVLQTIDMQAHPSAARCH